MDLFYGLWSIKLICTYFIHLMGILMANSRRTTDTYMPRVLITKSTALNSLFLLLKEKAETSRSLSTSFRMSSTRCVFLAPGYFHHRGNHPLTLIAHPLQSQHIRSLERSESLTHQQAGCTASKRVPCRALSGRCSCEYLTWDQEIPQ